MYHNQTKFFLLVLMLLWVGRGVAADMPVYSQGQTTIIVAPGQPQFRIQLEASPSTGYSWFLQNYDHRFIVPVKHYYQRSNSHLPGSPGLDIWQFKVQRAIFTGHRPTLLQFIYARPWENIKPVKQAVFKIVPAVSPDAKPTNLGSASLMNDEQ